MKLFFILLIVGLLPCVTVRAQEISKKTSEYRIPEKPVTDTVTISLTSFQTKRLLQADAEKIAAEKRIAELLEFIFDANHIDKDEVINFGYREKIGGVGSLIVIKARSKEDD